MEISITVPIELKLNQFDRLKYVATFTDKVQEGESIAQASERVHEIARASAVFGIASQRYDQVQMEKLGADEWIKQEVQKLQSNAQLMDFLKFVKG